MEYDLSVTIRRPPAAVFALLADVQDHIHPGSPVPVMEKIPPGPTRVGTRWREVVRLAPFVSMTIWSEVTAFEPGRRLEETFRGPWLRGSLAYTIEPLPEGCRLRQRQTLNPHGPLRLMARLMGRMFRPRMAARLESIRAGLEAGVVASRTGPA